MIHIGYSDWIDPQFDTISDIWNGQGLNSQVGTMSTTENRHQWAKQLNSGVCLFSPRWREVVVTIHLLGENMRKLPRVCQQHDKWNLCWFKIQRW